uniref:TetR family transcriptional regulator n=1 Tax=Actinomadura sp. SCN-SB TaxID=3373092 RepID=UPI0037526ED4
MRIDDQDDARVLDVATELFAGLGYEGTSMAMIADSAGITLADLTAKVDTKAELYAAVVVRARQVVLDRLARISTVFRPTRQGL